MENYTRLSMSERCLITTFLSMKAPISRIAERTGRHRSTIYREIKRNQKHDRYSPGKADAMAKQRHPHPMSKLQTHQALNEYVMERLKKGWSPEQISGRMRKEEKEFYICHESIYRYIYRNKSLGLFQLLAYKKPRRQRCLDRNNRKNRTQMEKRNISQRPEEVNLRHDFGHWEGDTIRFPEHQKSTMTTLIERKSRYVCLYKNVNKKSSTVIETIYQGIKAVPKKIWCSLTLDQGMEFMDFRVIERQTGCKIYFCNTHSPWQRGSNENMNGRIRRYLPKKFGIDAIDQKELDKIANNVNNTPRKCLSYFTPREIVCQHWKRVCRFGL